MAIGKFYVELTGDKGRRDRYTRNCTCQQKLDTKLKKLGIKIEYLYKIQ